MSEEPMELFFDTDIEKLMADNDALIAQRDQARNSELNCLEAYQRKIGPLEKEVNALRKRLDECELALDDMRLGRAIAESKLDIAREALKIAKNEVFDGIEGDFYLAWNKVDDALEKIGG